MTAAASQTTEAVARRLRMLRMVLSANQAEVARTLGVSTDAWNKYESGTNRLPVNVLSDFVSIYGTGADWILAGKLMSLDKPVMARLIKAFPNDPDVVAGLSEPPRP
jgi:DNA-binding XRE family transcriptional regulator